MQPVVKDVKSEPGFSDSGSIFRKKMALRHKLSTSSAPSHESSSSKRHICRLRQRHPVGASTRLHHPFHPLLTFRLVIALYAINRNRVRFKFSSPPPFIKAYIGMTGRTIQWQELKSTYLKVLIGAYLRSPMQRLCRPLPLQSMSFLRYFLVEA
jgi:hypothetical protein